MTNSDRKCSSFYGFGGTKEVTSRTLKVNADLYLQLGGKPIPRKHSVPDSVYHPLLMKT
ncbi:unnamed protein product [Acanthoscelides obtectus]|uniref:Uncharacterized protein n=1 Tax=Acanthoscelides obtectus TaxID=200917 RepID=A0A9P0L502_ACAOB|nr:unnamed protein product [Acanthoscelides obtectus]CAK1666289.1 hypothetical protein AOBTE_LOCUS25241 [Acanthoscelides obtectus]